MNSLIFKIYKIKKNENKRKWNEKVKIFLIFQEDKFIMEIKKSSPKIKWNCLSKTYNEKFKKNKKTFLIRSRLKYHLNPEVKTNKLSNEEKKLILEYYRIYGSKWSSISKNFPQR